MSGDTLRAAFIVLTFFLASFSGCFGEEISAVSEVGLEVEDAVEQQQERQQRRRDQCHHDVGIALGGQEAVT